MSMQTFYDLKKMLCKELEELTYAGNGQIRNDTELDRIDKLTHSIKSLETVIAMKESEYGGESGHYMPPYMWGNRSFEGEGGRSNAQRRNAMGQYSRDERSMRSSRGGANEEIMAELRELMQETRDGETRKKFERFIMDLEEG